MQHQPRRTSRKQLLFLILTAFFLGNALLAELVGGKLFEVDILGFPFLMSIGVVLWPMVFITTDLINEYFGRPGVKRLSLIGAGMIAYAFVALWLCGLPPAWDRSPVTDAAFGRVFYQSRWIIVGSIVAFLVAQLLDVTVFWLLRRRTGKAMLWLRATGSTVVSQLVDTIIVGFIGLHLPWLLAASSPAADRPGVDFDSYLRGAASSYVFKFGVAVLVTPVLYAVHGLVDRWLGEEAKELIETAAAEAA